MVLATASSILSSRRPVCVLTRAVSLNSTWLVSPATIRSATDGGGGSGSACQPNLRANQVAMSSTITEPTTLPRMVRKVKSVSELPPTIRLTAVAPSPAPTTPTMVVSDHDSGASPGTMSRAIQPNAKPPTRTVVSSRRGSTARIVSIRRRRPTEVLLLL